MGARANAWCLLIHAEASLSLSLSLSAQRILHKKCSRCAEKWTSVSPSQEGFPREVEATAFTGDEFDALAGRFRLTR